jgi:predicted transcriptional regulator
VKALKLVEGMRKRKFGPYPSFSPLDVLRAVWKLDARKGRGRLSRELGIGEWSTRTILRFLGKGGYVDATPMGYKLTKEGFRLLKELRKSVIEINSLLPSFLTAGKGSVGMLVRGEKPPSVLDVRDEAVRMGASGITLLLFKGGKFHFIDSGDELQSSYANSLKEINDKFKFQNGDMLLLCFGDDSGKLERAAWASFIKISKMG